MHWCKIANALEILPMHLAAWNDNAGRKKNIRESKKRNICLLMDASDFIAVINTSPTGELRKYGAVSSYCSSQKIFVHV